MSISGHLCRFSGAKIYPGRGTRFIHSDSQVFLFINKKCKRYFHNRLKPSKLTWIAMYRKQHKKDIAQEVVRKRRRTTKKPYSWSIVGATLEVIQKKRTERPKVQDAAREAALRYHYLMLKRARDYNSDNDDDEDDDNDIDYAERATVRRDNKHTSYGNKEDDFEGELSNDEGGEDGDDTNEVSEDEDGEIQQGITRFMDGCKALRLAFKKLLKSASDDVLGAMGLMFKYCRALSKANVQLFFVMCM